MNYITKLQYMAFILHTNASRKDLVYIANSISLYGIYINIIINY